MINAKNLVGAAASLGLFTSASVGLALGDEAVNAMVNSRGAAHVSIGNPDTAEGGYIIDWAAALDASIGNPDEVNAGVLAAANAAIGNPNEAGFMGGVRLNSDAAIGSLDALLNIGLNFGLAAED
jgi:hypothetical protein